MLFAFPLIQDWPEYPDKTSLPMDYRESGVRKVEHWCGDYAQRFQCESRVLLRQANDPRQYSSRAG